MTRHGVSGMVRRMTNKLHPNQVGASPQLALRVSPELIEALDREVQKLRELHPGLLVQRSDVARDVLHRALLVAGLAEPTAVVGKPAPRSARSKAKAKATPKRGKPRAQKARE
jgi:hypothetical protein